MARPGQYYRKAIELDPQYALAQAVYSDYLCGCAVIGISPARENLPEARKQALRALEMDPSPPEAQAMLCFCAAILDHDWKEAARRYKLAMEKRFGVGVVLHGCGVGLSAGSGARERGCTGP
jgi:hypothetical protein